MINVELLQEVLSSDEGDLTKFDLEQLRLSLGVFRYSVRVLEREINGRCSDEPLGNITE